MIEDALPEDAEGDLEAENRVSPEANPEESFGQARLHRLLKEAMAELSPDHRGVVELTYFQDLSYREIAEILGISPRTVETQLFRAIKKLDAVVNIYVERTTSKKSNNGTLLSLLLAAGFLNNFFATL